MKTPNTINQRILTGTVSGVPQHEPLHLKSTPNGVSSATSTSAIGIKQGKTKGIDNETHNLIPDHAFIAYIAERLDAEDRVKNHQLTLHSAHTKGAIIPLTNEVEHLRRVREAGLNTVRTLEECLSKLPPETATPGGCEVRTWVHRAKAACLFAAAGGLVGLDFLVVKSVAMESSPDLGNDPLFLIGAAAPLLTSIVGVEVYAHLRFPNQAERAKFARAFSIAAGLAAPVVLIGLAKRMAAWSADPMSTGPAQSYPLLGVLVTFGQIAGQVVIGSALLMAAQSVLYATRRATSTTHSDSERLRRRLDAELTALEVTGRKLGEAEAALATLIGERDALIDASLAALEAQRLTIHRVRAMQGPGSASPFPFPSTSAPYNRQAAS